MRYAEERQLGCFVERHHIIPRCLGGTDDASNIVKLTPEEHYVAHQLLVKIYPDSKKLVYAAVLMSTMNGKNRINNKLFGWIKRKLAKARSGPKSEAWYKAVTGKKRTVEQRLRMSTARTGTSNPCTDKRRKGLVEAWEQRRQLGTTSNGPCSEAAKEASRRTNELRVLTAAWLGISYNRVNKEMITQYLSSIKGAIQCPS